MEADIALLKPIWKGIERMMDYHLEDIVLHDSLHSCRNWRGTGTAVIEVKLSQAHIKQSPFYRVFIEPKEAFGMMDRKRCLQASGEYGAVGPDMRRFIWHFEDEGTNVCRASCNYGMPFKTGLVLLSDSLWAKLFIVILFDVIVWEWYCILRMER